jgi:hypothetical protein
MGYCVVDSFYRLYQQICFCISNANLKQILTDVDSVIIAAILTSAKVWVSYGEYTISVSNAGR